MGFAPFFPIRTRARTGTCQGCMAWATTPPPLTEKPCLLPQNPVLIFQHRLWMSDGAVGSQRGVTNALFNCCLHVCIHVHGPAHLQQSTPPWMGKAGACQGLTLTSHGHDGDKHKAGRPHMPRDHSSDNAVNVPWEWWATLSHL